MTAPTTCPVCDGEIAERTTEEPPLFPAEAPTRTTTTTYCRACLWTGVPTTMEATR